MNLQTLIAVLLSFLSFGIGWKTNDLSHEAQAHERTQQELDVVRQTAAASIRRTDNVIAAQNAQAARNMVLIRDASGSRSALVSLHASADQALRDAAASHDACLGRAGALGDVFSQCSEVLQGMAATCDRITSDRKTLIDAWPKE
jgi:hypothetical protein